MMKIEKSKWLKYLLFGFEGKIKNYQNLYISESNTYNLRYIEHKTTGRQTYPLAWPIYKVFGAAPPTQNYSLAKALVDSGKLLKLDELLKKLKNENHKILLFCQMTMMMNILSDYLNFRRYRSYFIYLNIS